MAGGPHRPAGAVHRDLSDDPAGAIGSAKQLIEATAKTVLRERGLPVDENAKMPALIKQAQKALALDASAASAPRPQYSIRPTSAPPKTTSPTPTSEDWMASAVPNGPWWPPPPAAAFSQGALASGWQCAEGGV
ncbi:hypothetical protein GCM10010519_06830 [Streptomyces lactacystinicus]